MKTTNVYLILTLVFAVFFSTGCKKQLNNVFPRDAIALEELGENDINALRNGMYSELENLTFQFWYDFDFRAVQFIGGPGFVMSPDPINIGPGDYDLQAKWSVAYTVLNKINFLLEAISTLPSPHDFDQIKGEALFGRALVYYNLVTRWGGVPILTSQSNAVVQRNPEADVWKQITDDLKTAIDLVSSDKQTFYISKPAVEAFLARVMLATGQNAEAVTYCDDILSDGDYALSTSALEYSSIWSAGGVSNSIIFALANNTSSNPHLFFNDVNDADGSWTYSPAPDLYNNLYSDKSLAKGDNRHTAVFSNDNTRIIKFPNGISGQQLAPTSNPAFTPIVLFRLAEIYLIKAEALGAGTEASTVLEKYLKTRYQTAPSVADLSALSSSAFQNLILDERHREFYGEGYRWFDLKRTGRTDLLTTLNGRDYLLYYPIPQNEIDLAGYEPNPGYN